MRPALIDTPRARETSRMDKAPAPLGDATGKNPNRHAATADEAAASG